MGSSAEIIEPCYTGSKPADDCHIGLVRRRVVLVTPPGAAISVAQNTPSHRGCQYPVIQRDSVRSPFGLTFGRTFGPVVDPTPQHDRTRRTISRKIPFHRSSGVPFQWNVLTVPSVDPPSRLWGNGGTLAHRISPTGSRAATVTPENGPTSVLSDARMNLSRALPIAPHSPTGKPGGLSPCQVKNEKFSILLQMPKRLGIWSKRTQCPFSNLQLLQLWSKRK